VEPRLAIVADTTSDIDDAELVRRTLQGDHTAFDRIMRRYNQRLYRLARGIIDEPSDAEDVLQESYVRAFYQLKTYSGRGSLGAWLAQIVRNEAIDRLRARKAARDRIALETELGSEDEAVLEKQQAPEDVRFSPQAATEAAEMKRVLEHAIAKLPDPFRAVFVLREVEGLSVDETSEYLGIPAATVKTRDHRARNLLRKELGERIDRTIPQTFEFLGPRCDALVARVLARVSADRN